MGLDRETVIQRTFIAENAMKLAKPVPGEMMLFVNACVRNESRTMLLANHVISTLGVPYTEVRLEDIAFPKTDEEYLLKRDQLIAQKGYSDPMFSLAKQFAAAARILIAAPYWDLSFPAMLKQYIEHINVLGITFMYTPEGVPKGLCKAKELIYVTTAGGAYVPDEYGYGYIQSLAQNFYGIPKVKLIKAAGLDLEGADPEKILRECMQKIQ